MEATRVSEMSVYNKHTWCHIPEDSRQTFTAMKTSNPTLWKVVLVFSKNSHNIIKWGIFL
jgi:hypothetical protein